MGLKHLGEVKSIVGEGGEKLVVNADDNGIVETSKLSVFVRLET
jgi:hypothetical protein